MAPDKGIVLVQRNGVQAALADVAELGKRRALDQALPRYHRDVAGILVHVGGLAHHDGNFLALLQLQQVGNVAALGGAAAFGYLVAFQAVHTALVRHEQHVVMRGANKQFLGKVIVFLGHAGHTAAAAVLGTVGVHRRALDVTFMGQGKDAGLFGDQVLNVHFSGNRLNGGAAVVTVLVGQSRQVGLDDLHGVGIVGQDILVIFNAGAQLAQLLIDLEDFQACETSQLQFYDSIGLRVVEAETLHNGRLCLCKAALAGADGGDDLIHNIHSLAQTFQDVLAVLGLFQLICRAAADDLELEVQIALHHGLQAHDLGHAVIQRQHDYTHGVLQLGVAVELVQHYLRVGVFLDLDQDLHAGAAGGQVVQVTDALNALIFDQVADGFQQAGLVDHVGDLGDHNLIPAVLLLHDLGTATQGDLAAACGICRTDAAASHNHAAGGEIGSLDVLHQARQINFRVINQGNHAADDFAQIVRRDVGGHADRNALAAVDQPVGEPAGQHVGFLLGFVKVRVPVNGILINIRQHFACNFGHAGFGITVSSRGVAVHGTKVALAVNQRITQAEILCQTHHRVIHTGIAVGVVSTQHSTNRIRRLAVRVAGVVAALVHRVQDAAVYGLQAIAHIRQGTGYDNGHGIIQKCRFDLLLDIAHNDLRARTGHHDNIFFHSTHLSDCFKALLQKLHRKSSLYHQNIKNKIHQRLAAAEISTVIRGGNRLPTRSGAAIRPAP